MIELEMPKGMKRVESGVIKFGDDWNGLFLRGDECIFLKQNLHNIDLLIRDKKGLYPESIAVYNLIKMLSEVIND